MLEDLAADISSFQSGKSVREQDDELWTGATSPAAAWNPKRLMGLWRWPGVGHGLSGSYLWTPDLGALWHTIHRRSSQSFAFQDFGPKKTQNSVFIYNSGHLSPIAYNEIICHFFFPICLETFANKHSDTGKDLCNEEAVAVEQSGPRAARTTTIHEALWAEHVAMQYLSL